MLIHLPLVVSQLLVQVSRNTFPFPFFFPRTCSLRLAADDLLFAVSGWTIVVSKNFPPSLLSPFPLFLFSSSPPFRFSEADLFALLSFALNSSLPNSTPPLS